MALKGIVAARSFLHDEGMSIATTQVRTRTKVFVYAQDAVTQAGLSWQLRLHSGLEVLDPSDIDAASVAVVAVDVLDETALPVIRATQRNGVPRVVVVAGSLDEESILASVEAGASGFVRRSESSPERLLEVVKRAERGDGSVPEDLVAGLLQRAGKATTPKPVLDDREVAVLRLVADGLDTAEIAAELAYSERTIKNVLHDVTSRLGLNNRSHAVAYAIRHGLI